MKPGLRLSKRKIFILFPVNQNTLKSNRVCRQYYYASPEKLKQRLQAFLNAYHFAKQLKTFKGLTPYEFIQNHWTNHPEKFKINPSHLNMKPCI